MKNVSLFLLDAKILITKGRQPKKEGKIWHQHYDYSVERSYRFPRTPVQDLLGLPSNMYPDKTALYFFGSEITFWELRTISLTTATI